MRLRMGVACGVKLFCKAAALASPCLLSAHPDGWSRHKANAKRGERGAAMSEWDPNEIEN